MPSIKFLFLMLGIFFQINCSSENDEVTFYTLTSYYDGLFSVPNEYPRFYQVEDSDAKCKTIEGYAIVNEFNTIYPKNKTHYYYADGSISEEYIEDLEIIKRDIYIITPGNSTINCKAGDNEFNITVHVVDYARYFSEKELKDYVEQNILKTEKDKLKQFGMMTQYISQYKYNSTYTSYIQLPITREGNSWAASSAIKFMAECAGIDAHYRVCSNDPESDEKNDINVIAIIDNKFYVSSIKYGESGRNSYSIIEIPNGYSFYQTKEDKKKIIIYQYDGNDENIVIPEKIDGKTVVGLDKKCFGNGAKYSYVEIKSIKIPSTITSIGDEVFSDLQYIEKLEIPKTITKLGTNLFEGCLSLKEIKVDKDNKYYSSKDGILYNKNKEILMYYPNNKDTEEFKVRNKTQKIDSYSFYGNTKLLKVNISKTVNHIGKKAFAESNIEEILFKGLPPKIENDSFYFLSVTIKYPAKNEDQWSSFINKTKDGNKDEIEDYGAWELNWEKVEGIEEDEEDDEEEEEDDKDKDDGGDSHTLVIVLVVVGIVVIICAIIFLIFIRKRGTSSTSIDSIGGEGLISDRNEIAL